MKLLTIALLILINLMIACEQSTKQKKNQKSKNKLEVKFQEVVVKKDFITKSEIWNNEVVTKKVTTYYYGYDKKNRLINKANSEFFEYDSIGRISMRYFCLVERDPTCNKPYIYLYEYSDGQLSKIKAINQFQNTTDTLIAETFRYDTYKRLIEHTKSPRDTFKFEYAKSDTLQTSETWISWEATFDSNLILTTRKSMFYYDKLKRKTKIIWAEKPTGISWKNEFSYDSQNRLTMKKDSALDNNNRAPNSCCILYWTNYKFDTEGHLIEENRSIGSYEEPWPHFEKRTIYEY